MAKTQKSRKIRIFRGRGERIGDWETFDGSTVAFVANTTPASAAPPAWGPAGGFNLACPNAPAVTVNHYQIAALMPAQQGGVSIPIGRASLAAIEATFDFPYCNTPVASGFGVGFITVAAGIYKTNISTGNPAGTDPVWSTRVPMFGRDLQQENFWLTHRHVSAELPDLATAQGGACFPWKVPSLSITWRGRAPVTQGQTLAIAIAVSGIVTGIVQQVSNIKVVPFIRAKFNYVV